MAAQKTITINGRLYDAVTGLPVANQTPTAAPKATASAGAKVASASKTTAKPAPKPAAQAVKPAVKPAAKPAASRAQTSSANVHGNVQKSKTLMRRAAKKPAAPHKVVRRPQPGRLMDISRNTNVAKFAPHPVVKEAPAAAATAAKAPAVKPKAAAPVSTKEVKDAAITKALNTPKAKEAKKPQNKWVKRILLVGSITVLLLLVLFAIYKFIPSVSVGIAAAQAGIEARYPDYTPDGYSLNQPVTYGDGEVNLQFRSNSNDSEYLINQKRSSWDSSAVLDNVVRPAVGENYTTTKERGLTIYTYDKGAAWVNGGILYTIQGNAALSGDQIRRLATSL